MRYEMICIKVVKYLGHVFTQPVSFTGDRHDPLLDIRVCCVFQKIVGRTVRHGSVAVDDEFHFVPPSVDCQATVPQPGDLVKRTWRDETDISDRPSLRGLERLRTEAKRGRSWET